MPKISQLPSGGAAQLTDIVPIVRNGFDYQVTLQAVATGVAQVNAPITTLSDAATITWDANVSPNATVTLAGTGRTLTMSNQVAGGSYVLYIKQDATGGRTITTWTGFKFPFGVKPTLSAAPNAVDILTFLSDGTNLFGVAQYSFA